jgi:membrane protease YdiL (CAAX protease family)
VPHDDSASLVRLIGRTLAASLRTFGRILVFLGFFLVFLMAGGLVASTLLGLDAADLVVGSTVSALAALLAGVVMMRFWERRPAGALGIAWTPATPKEVGLGLAIGAGGLAAAALAMFLARRLGYAPGPGTPIAWISTMAGGFGALAIAAFWEEVLFRGYPFQVLVQRAGPVMATFICSMLFAAAHADNPNVDPIALINIFLAGVLLSAAYLRTRSLWFATAVHLGWNWAMALPFDLPVSGLDMFDTPYYEPRIGDPRWFTGGAFGPEAGLVGTLGFGLALLAVMRLRAVQVAPAMRALRPLGLGEPNTTMRPNEAWYEEGEEHGGSRGE